MTPERIKQLRDSFYTWCQQSTRDEVLDEIERLSVNQLTDEEIKRLLVLVKAERCSTFPANWLQSLCVRLLGGGSVRVD